MGDDDLDLFDRARGLASARALIDHAIDDLIAQALASGVDMSALARSLRVHRSTIYRRVPVDHDLGLSS